MNSFGATHDSSELDEDGAAEMDMINWEQLEEEVNLAKAAKKADSRLLHSLNLREEIRRQLAEGDAQMMTTGNGLKKSKSAFLDDTSSSESDEDDGPFDEAVVTLSDCSSNNEDLDDDREFYLNDEFTTKITLHKTSASSSFRTVQESTLQLNEHSTKNAKPLSEKLVIRPVQSRPGLKTRIQNQKDLQICFLNDFPTRGDSPHSSTDSSDQFVSLSKSDGPSLLSQDFWSPPAESSSSKRLDAGNFMPKSKSMFEIESEKQRSDKFILKKFEESEMKWRQEMQIKIQHSHQRIHLQMQRQRKKQKKMPITSKVQFPHGKTRLDRAFLSDMNIAHLQIILNDLHGQIESLNDELVRLLEQRDELHMEQDSKLVDIDDLSRRLKDQWMSNWRRQRKSGHDVLPHNDSATSANKNAHQSPNGQSSKISNFVRNNSNPSSASSSNGSLQNFKQRIRSLLL